MSSTLRLIQLEGSCRGSQDSRLWALEDHSLESVAPDIQIMCDRCPVKVACLEYALENEVDDAETGVWGGTAPYQRRALKRKTSRVRCPGCRSDSVVPTYRGELCVSCGISWAV
jgi:hypothetical protein